MTEAAIPPADDVTGERPDEAQVQERVDLDPQEQPNAPNRAPQTEYVRRDLKDDSDLDAASDSDELDRPDTTLP